MSSTESPATPAPAPSEARLRSDARKAKIQARGEKGLAKLANTARGAEGAKMYETAAPTPKRTPSSTSLTASSPPPASNGSDLFSAPPPPSDSSPFGFPPGAGPDDPFAAMMAAMQAGGGGGGDPFAAFGGGGGNPFAGGPGGGGGFPPGMESMFAGGPPGAGGAPMMDQQYSNKKTLSDKLFTIAHFLGVLALVGFVVGWWEPRVLERKNATMAERGELEYWKGGGWGQKDFGVELPVFWAFVTLSLILQTTRLLLFRSRPPPSSLLSLLSPFLAFIPPNLKNYIFTASRYISMLTQFAQDLSLLVFAFGVARWVQGSRAGQLGRLKADSF
ncbi:hypothetical protein BDY24DRAFT_378294 [Mrakia frigida]|uniref:uncharacterized protein n=1 Tax=Mrakia frigida TaxID=29902 RepID=UPI003FCC0B8A